MKQAASASSRNKRELSSQRKSMTSRKNAATATAAAAAAAAPQTKKQPPKKKAPTSKKNNGSSAKAAARHQHHHHHHIEPPFDLYQNPSHPSFAEGFASIISMLQQCKKIVVLSGAGISVSCGIPDFRTHGSGLYSTLDFEAYGLSCAEELFDFDVFQENPVPFFKFARHLYYPTLLQNNNAAPAAAAAAAAGNDAGPGGGSSNSGDGATTATTAASTIEAQPPPLPPQRARPSDSHKLLALLEQKKKLLRVYSQNIDGLEQQAGVSAKKVVYAHGSLQWATCRKCKRKVSAKDIEADILAGNVAYCQAPVVVTNNHTNNNNHNNSHDTAVGAATAALPTFQSSCESTTTTRNRSNKRRRAASITTENNDNNNNNSTKNGAVCGGVLKPGVIFFGEPLKDTVGKCLEADRDKVDALIVIGTSLSVAPISKVIHYLPPNIPRILINRTIVHPEPKQQQAQQAQNNVQDDNDSTSSSDDEEQEEEDFRDDYVFDAYLLGYCDDVTRALAKHLFASPDEAAPAEIEVGRLVANLVENKNKKNINKLKENESHNNDDDEEEEEEEVDDIDDEEDSLYNAQDWASITVPKNRVFLFPGATPNNDLALSSSSSSSLQHGDFTVESSSRFCEIAHCDACAKRIVGIIKKCVTCFDYDLCPDCYPTISKTHHGGKHVFCAEPATPLVPAW